MEACQIKVCVIAKKKFTANQSKYLHVLKKFFSQSSTYDSRFFRNEMITLLYKPSKNGHAEREEEGMSLVFFIK